MFFFKNIFSKKYFSKYFSKIFFLKKNIFGKKNFFWNPGTQCSGIALKKHKFWDFKKSLFSKSFVNFSENTITKTFTSNSGLNIMAYRAVERHIMMGRRGFRVEQLKIQTFVFRFLGLVSSNIGSTLLCKPKLVQNAKVEDSFT